jgi:DNA-directed RNA polymerase specialized sigma24 family protein
MGTSGGLTSTSDEEAQMTVEQRFETFVKRHENMVLATAMRLVANQAEAEDIAHVAGGLKVA